MNHKICSLKASKLSGSVDKSKASPLRVDLEDVEFFVFFDGLFELVVGEAPRDCSAACIAHFDDRSSRGRRDEIADL